MLIKVFIITHVLLLYTFIYQQGYNNNSQHGDICELESNADINMHCLSYLLYVSV